MNTEPSLDKRGKIYIFATAFHKLYNHSSIKRSVAAAMLLLFALSITPKQWLHDIITNHKHYVTYNAPASVDTSKYQCNWQEQVIESPFIEQPAFRVDCPVIDHFSSFSYYTSSHYVATYSFSSLRGPPALV